MGIVANGIAGLAFFAFFILMVLMRKEGNDERTRYMGFKMFSFLYTFLLGGAAVIIFIESWGWIDRTLLWIFFKLLFSLHIYVGLGYWLYLRKKM